MAGLAKASGVSKSAIGLILKERSSIGIKVAKGVGRLFGMTLDQVLENAEREFAAKFEETRVERPERYPNRAAVLALLRADLDPEVVTRVESRALSSPTDMPKMWWIRTVLNEQEAVRLERENPLAVAAARAKSEALSDDVNAKIEAHRAKRPKRAPR
jgi:transcriptional regulator with XRE-family HTH domain